MDASAAARPEVEVRRSKRRRRTVSAYRDGDRSGSPTTDLMGSQAKDLTDQQIADLSAYFGSRETKLHDLHMQ